MKVTITGYMSMSGTSYKKDKKGVKYDINVVKVLQDLTSGQSENYTRIAGGTETIDLQVSNEFIQKIQGEKSFPFAAEVSTEQYFQNGRISTVVKDYQKV